MSDVYLHQATLTNTKAGYIRGMEKQDLGFELKASCVNNSCGGRATILKNLLLNVLAISGSSKHFSGAFHNNKTK